MFNVQISFRGQQDERRRVAQFGKQLGRAALFATDKAATAGQRGIRTAMSGVKLGRLSRTVKVGSDLKKGAGTSVGSMDRAWRAGAFVFRSDGSERGAGSWAAYARGAVIVPTRGKWLAFPTGNVPKRAGRRKMTPALYASTGKAGKHGDLVFIHGPRANVAYLIARNVTVAGGNAGGAARRRGKRGGLGGRQAREFVVMFILIRRTTRGKRFAPEQIARAEAQRAPAYMADYLSRNSSASALNFTRPAGSLSGPARGRLGGF